jgi:5'-3' exonuclease
MTLLIDADYLIYSSCCACEHDIRFDVHNHNLIMDEREAMSMIDFKLKHYQNILDTEGYKGSSDVVMCFTDYPTFRHEIFTEYKINRISKRKPLGLGAVIKEVKNNYESVSYPNLEGDDVLGLLSTNNKYDNPVIVSVDKDMKTIPGLLLAGDTLELITRTQADKNFMAMTIAGDATDGVPGIKGLGMVSATKILDSAKDLASMWDLVVKTYDKKGNGISDAILNARLVRILREGDYDYDTGEVRLWNPTF